MKLTAEQIRDEVISLHPYKIVGDHSTYDQYNQGWEDACYILEERLTAYYLGVTKRKEDEINRLKIMIDEGVHWDDLKSDITYPNG